MANPDAGRKLTDNALSFDRLVNDYVAFVNRLTPGDDRDLYMRIMEPHIGNIVEIYRSLPSSRLVDGNVVDAGYVEPMDKLLGRRELQTIIGDMVSGY